MHNAKIQLELFCTRNFELNRRSIYVTCCLRFTKILTIKIRDERVLDFNPLV